MVRTKENAGLKIGAKAPRKGLSGPSTSAAPSTSAKKPREDSGGNPVCPRETPVWQKPITDFFRQQSTSKSDDTMEEDVATSNGTSADGGSKENVNPKENRDVNSKSSPEGKETTENKSKQTSEPGDDVNKSDVGDREGGGVVANSAGSSKE